MSRDVKSILSGAQRAWMWAALAAAGLLIVNTLYLIFIRLASHLPSPMKLALTFSDEVVPKLFQFMVLSHTGMGFVVTALFTVFAVWHLPVVWRRRRKRMVVSGVAFVALGAAMFLTGRMVVQESSSRENGWVWWMHVALGVLVPVAYLVHRRLSYVRVHLDHIRNYAASVVGGLALVLVVHFVGGRGMDRTAEARAAAERGMHMGPGSKNRDSATLAGNTLISASYVAPESPFFPSLATTTTGDYLPERIITRGDTPDPFSLIDDLGTFGFVHRARIGSETCGRCHMDIVEQWAASAHRFASFNNPFYEASITAMRKEAEVPNPDIEAHIQAFPEVQGRVGEIKSKWCSGCHDPALMLAGSMDDDIDRRSPQAQAGLTCLACHAIDQIHNTAGNANYNVADEHEDPYVFAHAPTGSFRATLHDTAIKAKPEAHRRQMLKPFFRTGEFCSACHKVSLPEALNNYRWLRGQNEYDNWHDSGMAWNASRTFYLPPARKVCQDCHMPLEDAPLGDVAAQDGKVRSHRFLAVNTALPFIRGDQETIERTENFLRDEKLRIDVFALQAETADGTRQVVMALDKRRPELPAGHTVTVDVVVRNVGVGHTFPGGTNDSNESWIEFTVLDDEGRIVAQSGGMETGGRADSAAHFFRALLVDRNSNPIRRRNPQDIYATVYANVIGPGTAHTVHYALPVPSTPGRGLTIRARLMWRKFDRDFTEFAFSTNREGFKRFYECPDLPVTEICHSEVRLNIGAPTSSGALVVSPSEPPFLGSQWMRYNDYGIGLLLQGDTRGAEGAFAEVQRLRPDLIDGPRNLARVALQDGDLERALQHLSRCEEISAGHPQTAWFWGVALQEAGRYEDAVAAYRRVLDQFPDDRAAWRNLGRTYYLANQYDLAIEALTQALSFDAEDRMVHYHLMLAYRALGQESLATAAEEAYQRFKVDESADAVTQAYRLSHPHDHLESLPIHVHELALNPGADARLAAAQGAIPHAP